MDAMKLLKQYAEVDGKTRFHGGADTVPMDGVVRKEWHEAVVDRQGKAGRISDGPCVLVALRDVIRRCETYSRARCGGATRRTTCPATSGHLTDTRHPTSCRSRVMRGLP